MQDTTPDGKLKTYLDDECSTACPARMHRFVVAMVRETKFIAYKVTIGKLQTMLQHISAMHIRTRTNHRNFESICA